MTHFEDLDLRIGKIKSVKNHPNADKLFILAVNLGEVERGLQLVAGLKGHYKENELIGKKVVVFRNLKPAVLRGIESFGMILAAEDKETISLLVAPKSKLNDPVFIEGTESKPIKEVSFEDWQKIKFTIEDNNVIFDGKQLKTSKENIKTDRKVANGSLVR